MKKNNGEVNVPDLFPAEIWIKIFNPQDIPLNLSLTCRYFYYLRLEGSRQLMPRYRMTGREGERNFVFVQLMHPLLKTSVYEDDPIFSQEFLSTHLATCLLLDYPLISVIRKITEKLNSEDYLMIKDDRGPQGYFRISSQLEENPVDWNDIRAAFQQLGIKRVP